MKKSEIVILKEEEEEIDIIDINHIDQIKAQTCRDELYYQVEQIV